MSEKSSKTGITGEIGKFLWTVLIVNTVRQYTSLLKKAANLSKKQCPKCDSFNIKTVKPSLMKQAFPGSAFLLFGPIGLLAKKPESLNVCRDCSFSWTDR